MENNFHPELDNSPFLSDDDAAIYRTSTGSLNWVITLGRFDVHYATSVMSRFNIQPREGYFKAVKRILTYLKTFPKARLIFDTSYPDHSQFVTEEHNWSDGFPEQHTHQVDL